MIARYDLFKRAMNGSVLNVCQVQLIAKEKFIEQEMTKMISLKSGQLGKIYFQEVKKKQMGEFGF